MSYILDALRKSDLQRQRGAAPTLLTTHVTADAPKQPPLLLYGLMAAALVGTGMVIGWLQPWQTQQPVPAPEIVAAKPPAASPRPTTPAPAPATLETVRKPERELPVRKSTPAAQPAPVRATANIETPGTAPKAPAANPVAAAAPVSGQSAGTRPADAAQDQRVMNISELPPAIQQAIPRMSISVHAYSPKLQDRIVMINGRMMHEGQELALGLTLEQITPDGMIFSFGGYRFRRGLQQSAEASDMK